jgi:hypothetical protein
MRSLALATGMLGLDEDTKSVRCVHAQRVASAATQPSPTKACRSASQAQGTVALPVERSAHSAPTYARNTSDALPHLSDAPGASCSTSSRVVAFVQSRKTTLQPPSSGPLTFQAVESDAGPVASKLVANSISWPGG